MKTAAIPKYSERSTPTETAVDIGAAHFLGLDFHPMSVSQAAAKLAREASRLTTFSYVVTPNVDHMVRLDRDPALKPLYDEAGLVLNDSRVLEVLAERDGLAFPASPGADLVEFLFRHRIDPAEPVVIVGCTEEDVRVIKEQFGLKDVRWHNAPMGLRTNPKAVVDCAAFMAANPARFHFLCVGSPQQEMVAWAARQRGDVVGVGLCCGASLDFLSGKTDRAPRWMRRMRLEWLHRLASEPRRMWKRYLVDGPAIMKIWRRYRRIKPA